MNNLLMVLVQALRQHRWLCLFGVAYIFSSVGNGLTQTLILGQLLRWHAPPSTLTLTYMLATLPGFIGSYLGERLCRRVSPLRLLLLSELAGMVSLLLPAYGLMAHSTPSLLALQSIEALLAGLSWPAMSLLFKRGLSTSELPAATAMETVIFASQVLLGTGIGVLLFDRVSPATLLCADAISFLLSAVFLLLAMRCLGPIDEQPDKQFATQMALRWHALSCRQKRSLLLLPALAAVGAPAMALLPALAQQIRPDETTGLALPLIFARSLGQLCGPLLLNADRLGEYARSNRYLLGCLLIFLAAYALLPGFSAYRSVALLMIFLAHLASNMVFALGTFSVLNDFTAETVSVASGKAWRWQAVNAALTTGIAAIVAAQWGAAQALYTVSFTSLTLVMAILVRYRH
ncbi:MFS transporter [Pseudescherichia sp.]|uniref:MFS transporter n=1 Tax=Pseudescherichia sp. TaxID=2055881 RepID=UPI0028A1366D|nr:MFS transporter [Pseudescherichia sp.]